MGAKNPMGGSAPSCIEVADMASRCPSDFLIYWIRCCASFGDQLILVSCGVNCCPMTVASGFSEGNEAGHGRLMFILLSVMFYRSVFVFLSGHEFCSSK